MQLAVAGNLLAVVAICCISILQAQPDPDGGMETIVSERSLCISERQMVLQCPEQHMVVVRSAKYFQSMESGCNPDSSNICEVEDVREIWLKRCWGQNHCVNPLRLSPMRHSPCGGYTGEAFVVVSYRCEPPIGDAYLTNSRDMCNMEKAWQGSLLYLYSPNFPRWNEEPDCGCSVAVDSNIQLEITLSQFKSSKQNDSDCDQMFYIQSGSSRMTMCTEQHERDFQPLDVEYKNNVYFKFENTAGGNYLFLLVLQVHHQQHFTVRCKKNYQLPPLLPPPTSPTTERTTGNQEISANRQTAKENDNVAMHWPIITGVIGVVCVFLIISMAVLLFYRKQNKKKRGSTTKLAFDNDMYLSGNQASSPRNQTIINMDNIDKVHVPKHKEITSLKPTKPTMVSTDTSVDKEKKKAKEQMGLQTEASIPHDVKGTVSEQKEKEQTKHPSLFNLGGKTLSELKRAYPDIPESVLKELGSQSEAVIAITNPNLKSAFGKTSSSNSKDTPKAEPTKDTPKTEEKPGVPFDRTNSQRSTLTERGSSVKDRVSLSKSKSFSAADKRASVGAGDSTDTTPYSSMSELNVKDKAKLLKQQLKTAKD